MRKLTEGEREVVDRWDDVDLEGKCPDLLQRAYSYEIGIFLRLARERKAIDESGVLEDGARMADQLQLRIDLCKRCGPHSSGCMECSDNQATILTFRKALARLDRKET